MKRMYTFSVLLSILVFILCSCSNTPSIPDEKKLIEDLTSKDSLIYSGAVTDIEILKRLTDEENRTDTVYVTATLDYEKHTTLSSYVMDYVLYNDGWLLENADVYSGSDSIYQIIPKAPPTDEEILNEVGVLSSSNISYNQYTLTEDDYAILYTSECIDSFFFEKGCYTSEIAESVIDEHFYNTTMVTHRQFDYADVTETADVSLYFDDMYDHWLINQYTVTDLAIDWHLEGTWYTPDGVQGQIVDIGPVVSSHLGSDQADVVTNYRDKFNYRWKNVEGSILIYRPSSQMLLTTKAVNGTGSYTGTNFIQFCASPNGLFFWNEDTQEYVPMIRYE